MGWSCEGVNGILLEKLRRVKKLCEVKFERFNWFDGVVCYVWDFGRNEGRFLKVIYMCFIEKIWKGLVSYGKKKKIFCS